MNHLTVAKNNSPHHEFEKAEIVKDTENILE